MTEIPAWWRKVEYARDARQLYRRMDGTEVWFAEGAWCYRGRGNSRSGSPVITNDDLAVALKAVDLLHPLEIG